VTDDSAAADEAGIPVAATVVVARDAAGSVEVAMIERPDRGSFAGAWVFPGGKLEPGDGDGAEEQVARGAAVRETREETGLVLDAAALVTQARWDPPPGIPLRIRTWFFAARASSSRLVLQSAEVVAGDWVRPAEMLRSHAAGALTLYPPTWVTLHWLAGFADTDAMLRGAQRAGLQRFRSVLRRGEGGPLLLWEGDGEYDQDAPASGARHRLQTGALPWVYTRS